MQEWQWRKHWIFYHNMELLFGRLSPARIFRNYNRIILIQLHIRYHYLSALTGKIHVTFLPVALPSYLKPQSDWGSRFKGKYKKHRLSSLSTIFLSQGEISNHKWVFDENSNDQHVYSFFTLYNVSNMAYFENFQVCMIIKSRQDSVGTRSLRDIFSFSVSLSQYGYQISSSQKDSFSWLHVSISGSTLEYISQGMREFWINSSSDKSTLEDIFSFWKNCFMREKDDIINFSYYEHFSC